MVATLRQERAAAPRRLHWELLVNLVRKDIKVKYQGSALGFAWSLATPLVLTAVYYLVFHYIANNGIDNYVLYLMSGLLVWSAFQNAVTLATGSVVGNAGLVKKVRLPLQVLPLAAIGFAAVHFVLQMGLLLAVLTVLGYGIWGWQLLLLIPATALVLIFATGLGLLVAALNVRYRDVQHLVEVAMLAWFFLNPVLYGAGLVRDRLGGLYWAYFLNPMAAVVGTFQRAIYQTPTYAAPDGRTRLLLLAPGGYRFYLEALGIGMLVALVVLGLGLAVFHRLSADFAEEL